MERRFATTWIAVLLAFGATASFGASVESWEVATGEAFARGTLDGTQIDGDGMLRLSPEFKTVWGPEEGIVWTVAPDGSGGAFVGLSGPGRLIHVGKDGNAEVWYEVPDDGLLTSLAADGAGGVFLGVSPSGRVLHATAAGVVDEVASTGAEFVWALLFDTGRLWIGTGVPGKILLRSADGTVSTRLESAEDPVRCLAAFRDGEVVAGTGQRGRIIRVGERTSPFVIYDSDETEIVSVAADANGLFALAAGTVTEKPTRSGAPVVAPGFSETVRVTAEDPSDRPPSGTDPPVAKSKIPKSPTRPGAILYRIDVDGGTFKIWQSTSEVPYAVMIDRQGFPIVATGDRGKIVRLDRDGNAVALLGFPSSTATSLVPVEDGRILIGGSGDARLAVLGPAPVSVGRYLSEPLDARSIATWGRLEWDAMIPRGSRFVVRARAGNTAEPDETWSGWSDVDVEGDSGGAEIPVPVSRFLQIEVEITAARDGSGAALRRLTTYYQPRNRPPRIESLSIEHPGIAWARVQQQSGVGRGPLVTDDPIARKAARIIRPVSRGSSVIRRSYESGARTFSWEAKDPDGDVLVFTLQFRVEGGDHWYPLASEIEDSFFSWDSRGMPDGHYRVRLLADDGRGNVPGESFARERVSDPFRIDHTPPVVAEVEIEQTSTGFIVSFEARDPGGRIAAAEYALEDGPWETMVPADGVADAAVERYSLKIERGMERNGERNLRIRVIDALGNLGGDYAVLSGS